MDRVSRILPSIKASNSPTHNMKLLLQVIDTTTIVPQPDNSYTFVYKAKTKGLKYDQHPLIICTSIHPWGFIGYNFHWPQFKQYTWDEIKTNLFELYDEEIPIVKQIPTAKFKRVL